MPLHPQIIEHLQRLGIPVPDNLDATAVEILSKRVDWPRSSFNTAFDRRRDGLVASGNTVAATWNGDDLLEHSFQYGPMHSVGLNLGQAVMLEFYTGTDPDVSTAWSECSSHIHFLEENPEDPSDPFVTALDHEEVAEVPGFNGKVSEILALLVVKEEASLRKGS